MPRTRKNKKRMKLSGLSLDFVSLLPAGDDPMAKVVLAKAHPDSKTGEDRMAKTKVVKKADLPPDVREYIDALEEIAEEAIAKGVVELPSPVQKDDDEEEDEEVEEEEDDDVEEEDIDDELDDDDEDEEEEDGEEEDEEVEELETAKVRKAIKKADPEVRVLLKSILKKADQSERALKKTRSVLRQTREDLAKTEKVARGERTRRERAGFVEIAKGLPMINTNADELGADLYNLHKKDPALAQRQIKILKAANQNITESNVFDEIGSANAEKVPEAEAKLAEIRKADPKLSNEEAMDQLLQANPDLYDQMIANEG